MGLNLDGLKFGWAYIWMGLNLDGHIFGWAYIWMGIFSEFYGTLTSIIGVCVGGGGGGM